MDNTGYSMAWPGKDTPKEAKQGMLCGCVEGESLPEDNTGNDLGQAGAVEGVQ